MFVKTPTPGLSEASQELGCKVQVIKKKGMDMDIHVVPHMGGWVCIRFKRYEGLEGPGLMAYG